MTLYALALISEHKEMKPPQIIAFKCLLQLIYADSKKNRKNSLSLSLCIKNYFGWKIILLKYNMYKSKKHGNALSKTKNK